ncbi:MAG: bifunctional nuclease family protein [Acidobacteriota bacterium]
MDVEMKVKSLMMDPVTQMPIVILRNPAGDSILPIWVGLFEANAIALQLEKISTPRPMTHDLLRQVLTTMEAQVERIVITDLRENTFYATVHLRYHGRALTVDSRPSDAIALALRTESPIFVNSGVIDKASKKDISEDPAESERLRHWLEKLEPGDLGKYEN